MSVAARLAPGFLPGVFFASGVLVLVLKIEARRRIRKEAGGLLRLKLWPAAR
jgi:hypothetical protein